MSNNTEKWFFGYSDISEMVKVEKTDIERKLERTQRSLNQCEARIESKNKERATLNKDLQLAQQHHKRALSTNTTWLDFYNRRLERLRKEEATYRLMNDIRLGKIIPIIAETGNVADVTFS